MSAAVEKEVNVDLEDVQKGANILEEEDLVAHPMSSLSEEASVPTSIADDLDPCLSPSREIRDRLCHEVRTNPSPATNVPAATTEDETKTVFSHTEKIVLIVASILFSVFILVLLGRLCQITCYRIRRTWREGRRGSQGEGEDEDQRRRRALSAREKRVRGLIDRPGVRDILASRVEEAKVREGEEKRKRRAEIDSVIPKRPSVVRMAPSPQASPRGSPCVRGEKSKRSNLPRSAASTPPPAYCQVDVEETVVRPSSGDGDRASVYSDCPPPSYHSKMGDE